MSFSRLSLVALAGAAGLALAPASAGAIVGGTNAPAGKYPSVANVTIGLFFGCTGTLVAPQWVLTAGHCSSLTGGAGVATPANYPPASFVVTVGGVRSDGKDGEPVTVDRVTTPSDYLLADGYDVSLLHLAAPAKAPPTPVAGRGREGLWAPGVLEEIAGFGVTAEGGDAPPTLQQASVPIIADASCAASYPRSFEAETQICAGYPQGGTDSCQGDSGGPLFSRTAGGLFVVGSTSYGRGCGRPNLPGVYARVADVTLRDGFVRKAAPDAVADAPAGAPAPAGVAAPQSPTPAGPAAAPPTAPLPAPGTAGGSPAGGSPAGGSTTTTTRSGTTVAAVTRSGFGAALTVDRAARRTVRARGLRVGLRCSAACTARIRLQVSAATARRLGLASRTVGTAAVARKTAGRTTTSIRISRGLVRKLKTARGAVLSARATVAPTVGGPPAVLTARAVLTGR